MAEYNCINCKYGNTTDDFEHCGNCDKGSEFVKMTNADRIRSMSDEELADFLEEFKVCTYCKYNDEDRCRFENPCTHDFAGIMAYEWLKSEVE